MNPEVKKLVVCANCQTQGTRSVLGEYTTEGAFLVMRFHRGYTMIQAENYMVICGNCSEPNLRRGTYAQ